MPSLLREVRDAAVASDAPLTNLLRNVLSWVTNWITTTFGTGRFKSLTGTQTRMSRSTERYVQWLPDELRDRARSTVLPQGAANLEKLMNGDGILTFSWPGNLILSAEHTEQLPQGISLNDVRQIADKSALARVLDAIRNRVLEFCLRLGKERPELMTLDGASFPTAADSAATKQVFNLTIKDSQIGSIANASLSAQQTAQINVTPGDVTSLMKTLIGAGVPASEAEALKTAIGEESGQAAKQKCDSWLKRAEQAVTSGAWSLAKGVTTDTLRKAVLAYLGLG